MSFYYYYVGISSTLLFLIWIKLNKMNLPKVVLLNIHQDSTHTKVILEDSVSLSLKKTYIPSKRFGGFILYDFFPFSNSSI